MELCDGQVLVVTRVANERHAILVARDIGAVTQEQTRSTLVVKIGLVIRTLAVHTIEIEAWRAEIHEPIRIILLLQAARRIERQVMIDELADDDNALDDETRTIPVLTYTTESEGEEPEEETAEPSETEMFASKPPAVWMN